ncbi:Hypothetical protein PBC10988_13050 [Planctomycetales bacterium 10988]|nr:Hypothetical protein PBC10988_13050 [Planctomycetales bacterium 10988]
MSGDPQENFLQGDSNPFKSPESEYGQVSVEVDKELDVRHVLRKSLDICKGNLRVIIVGSWMMAVSFAVCFYALMAIPFMIFVVFNEIIKTNVGIHPLDFLLFSALLIIFFYLPAAILFLSSWLITGLNRYLMAVVRGQRLDYKMIFEGKKLWPLFGTFFLLFLVIVAGLLLLVVPGIFLALCLWPAPYLISENRYRAIDSFKVAWELMEGNRRAMLLLALALLLINAVGALPAYVGLLFTVPYTLVVLVVSYFELTDQPTYLDLKEESDALGTTDVPPEAPPLS